jgi:hypothetical protein
MPLAMIGRLVKASPAEQRAWHMPKEASQVPCNGITGIDTKVSSNIGTRCGTRLIYKHHRLAPIATLGCPSPDAARWRRNDGLYKGARTAITVSLRS